VERLIRQFRILLFHHIINMGCTTVVLKTESGKEILIRQIAGAVARRVVFYTSEGLSVKQGEDLGFIKFGSRVDVFLPLNSKINVSLNQVVKGNQTVLAEI